MSLSPEKIRAARALLNWSQDRLAREASIGATTLKRLEKIEDGKPWNVSPVVEKAIATTLTAAGIVLDPKPEDLSEHDIVACVALRRR